MTCRRNIPRARHPRRRCARWCRAWRGPSRAPRCAGRPGSHAARAAASSGFGKLARWRRGTPSRAARAPLATLIERRGVVALQVNGDRARRAADAAEQLPFGGEHARIGQSDGDLVAHEPLKIADALLIDDARTDRAAAGPRQDVPVLQASARSRRPCTGFMRSSIGRQQFAIDGLRAHAGRKLKNASMAARLTGGR